MIIKTKKYSHTHQHTINKVEDECFASILLVTISFPLIKSLVNTLNNIFGGIVQAHQVRSTSGTHIVMKFTLEFEIHR